MKTALVTGASSGIGYAIAEKLLKEGYNVGGLARRVEKLAPLEKYPEFLPIKADVTNVLDVKWAHSAMIERFGQTNIIVNNAGVGYLGRMDETDLKEWHKMFDVNVNGLLTVTHTWLPELKDKQGHIINIDSVAGHEVYPDGIVYCATKHAVRTISVGLEKELKGMVRVTNISPGPVETEFADHTTHPEKSAQMQDYFKNVLKSEDIANAVWYAISQPDHVAINEVMVRPFK